MTREYFWYIIPTLPIFFGNAYGLNFERVNCSIEHHPFMVFIVTVDRGNSTNSSDYKLIGAGVLLSPIWVITASTNLRLITNNSLVHYGSDLEYDPKGKLTPISNIIEYPTKDSSEHYHELALFELQNPVPLNPHEGEVTMKPLGLPPSKDYSTSCREVQLIGWPQRLWTDSKYLLCVEATREDDKEKCPYEHKLYVGSDLLEVVFCMEGMYGQTLSSMPGNAIVCKERHGEEGDQILIGITKLGEELLVGDYMTWICESTGIKVAYQSSPQTGSDYDRSKHSPPVTSAAEEEEVSEGPFRYFIGLVIVITIILRIKIF